VKVSDGGGEERRGSAPDLQLRARAGSGALDGGATFQRGRSTAKFPLYVYETQFRYDRRDDLLTLCLAAGLELVPDPWRSPHPDTRSMCTLLRRTARSLAAVLIAAALAACPQKTAVWIPENSTAASLVFHLGQERGRLHDVALDVLRVRRCDDTSSGQFADSTSMWTLYAVDRAPEVSRVRYGEIPQGFRSAVGPRALGPGCYTVHVSGTGSARFSVAGDGRIADDRQTR
jgi:hypothetical protein